MKQFIVLSKIGFFNGTVVRDFDNEADAREYAQLMRKSENSEHITYFVAKIVELEEQV